MSRGARTTSLTLGVVTAAGVAAVVWGTLVERNRFTVRHEILPILDPGSRPLTILQVSDLHLAPGQHTREDFVRSLIRFEPDLVIDTGDNLGHLDGNDPVEHALAPFRGVAGAFVHGSNDYHAPVFKNPFRYFMGPTTREFHPADLDTSRLERFLENDLGWLNLNNAAHSLEIRGIRIELFGTADAHRGWDRLDTLPRVIDELRENVEWTEAGEGRVLRIGVTHAPYRRVLDAFATLGANLILAGHTHGGQVRIPGLPALVTNCDIPPHQSQGLSVWRAARARAFLNVSAGIGTSTYAPFRFACPPEAVVITLTAAR